MTADPQASRFVLEFATALHRAGTPAHRLEGVCDLVAQHLGVQARIFSLPTALFAAIGSEQDARTELVKIAPGAPDLGLQSELDAIAEGVLADRTPLPEASNELVRLRTAQPRWGLVPTLLAFALTGTTAAIVLGGGIPEALVSTGAGLAVGAMGVFVASRPALANVFEPVATFLAMAIGVLVHRLIMPLDVVVVTLASVIVLVPGLSLTTSIVELASRNLVSGTARLAGAMVVFVSMAVGGALAATLDPVLAAALPPPSDLALVELPECVRWAVLPVVGIMLAVLLRARPRDIPWCMLAPVVAVGLQNASSGALGPVFGVGLAGLGLTVASNAVSRLRHRPASTMLVPGILLLVPGTAGLRAILKLVDHDVIGGVDSLFAAILVATSLSAGVLLANVVVQPRRAL